MGGERRPASRRHDRRPARGRVLPAARRSPAGRAAMGLHDGCVAAIRTRRGSDRPGARDRARDTSCCVEICGGAARAGAASTGGCGRTARAACAVAAGARASALLGDRDARRGDRGASSQRLGMHVDARRRRLASDAAGHALRHRDRGGPDRGDRADASDSTRFRRRPCSPRRRVPALATETRVPPNAHRGLAACTRLSRKAITYSFVDPALQRAVLPARTRARWRIRSPPTCRRCAVAVAGTGRRRCARTSAAADRACGCSKSVARFEPRRPGSARLPVLAAWPAGTALPEQWGARQGRSRLLRRERRIVEALLRATGRTDEFRFAPRRIRRCTRAERRVSLATARRSAGRRAASRAQNARLDCTAIRARRRSNSRPSRVSRRKCRHSRLSRDFPPCGATSPSSSTSRAGRRADRTAFASEAAGPCCRDVAVFDVYRGRASKLVEKASQ